MRIYIDEAGNFLPPATRPYAFSLVLALVIPSACESQLFYHFLRLRDSWPNRQIEIKGSAISEPQAAEIIDFLARYDVIAELRAVDTATHTDAVVGDFKIRQGDAITANLTSAHHLKLAGQLYDLRHSVHKMPNQLFLQAFPTLDLVLEVVQEATAYYVQRQPEELGDIAWFVDRKSRSLTEMEDPWTKLILPIGESRSLRQPFLRLEGYDYSHFRRYELDSSNEQVARHLRWLEEVHGVPMFKSPVVNAKRLHGEQLYFRDSRDSLGIQLADILASILRRALNGNLQFEGWKGLGGLLLRKNDTRLIQMGSAEPNVHILNDPHIRSVWDTILLGYKNMLAGD